MPGRILVVVESPTKAKEVSHILGPQYQVLASFGHVRDLPKNEMGVEPPSFKLKYVPTERGGGQLAKIRAAAKEASRILLATDPDREGEAIAWHIADALKLPASKTSRISYNEITERAVKAAVASPRPLDMRLVHAQEARRGIDRLVGYTVSPALGRGLSAGRVQTPALRLLVERERAILAHNKVKHFGAELTLPGTRQSDAQWAAKWDAKPFLKQGEEYCLDRALAAKAAAVKRVVVTGLKTSVRTRNAPAPFTSSTLQQAASSKLNMSPGETMQLAQRLFERTFITYHRSDSVAMATEAVDDIRAYARKQGLPLPAAAIVHQSRGKVVQGAHECIRATDVWLDSPRGLTAREQSLYELIRDQAIASQLAPMTADVTDVQLESEKERHDDRPFSYGAQGVKVTHAGWSTVLGGVEEIQVPSGLAIGTVIAVTTGRVLELETKPPARYTEASLIKELERLGIGRPSTFASIIETLKHRVYAVLQGKTLSPTSLGMGVADALSACSFYDLQYTAELEEMLDKIADGQAAYGSVMAAAYMDVQSDVGRVDSSAVQIPAATGAPQARPLTRGGKSLPKRGRKTQRTSKTRRFKTPARSNGKSGVGKKVCPECGSPMVRRRGRFGEFFGCSKYPECRHTEQG